MSNMEEKTIKNKYLSIILIVVYGIAIFWFAEEKYCANLWVSIGTGIIAMWVASIMARRDYMRIITNRDELIGGLKVAVILIWSFILYLNLPTQSKDWAWSLSFIFIWFCFWTPKLLLREWLPKTKRWYNKKLW